MQVIVLGSGIIGVTTAYYLRKAGHDVTVIDRQPAAGLETSYANAGEISTGYASPWAAPGVPLKALKWLFMKHAPLILRPRFELAMWVWLFRMLGNCTAQRYAINKGRILRIAEYSRDCLIRLRAETGIAYDERSLGTLQLFRTKEQLDAARRDIEVLKVYGVPFEVLDSDGCVAAEPGLAGVRDKIAGGLRLPGDETGDCYMFTQRLAELAADLGVIFHYDTTVLGLKTNGKRIMAVVTTLGDIKGDTYVVALGSFSSLLLRPIGISLPVYPVKGYSITVPITDAAEAPVSTIMDETFKIAITRLGDRIRVGGLAELSGYDTRLVPTRRKTLEHVLSDLFPCAGDLTRATFWSGLRPMTPDGTPIIGGTRYSNLYLNTGHGTLGWTMACGSGRVLSDLLSGRLPDIDVSDLSVSRYAAGRQS